MDCMNPQPSGHEGPLQPREGVAILGEDDCGLANPSQQAQQHPGLRLVACRGVGARNNLPERLQFPSDVRQPRSGEGFVLLIVGKAILVANWQEQLALRGQLRA